MENMKEIRGKASRRYLGYTFATEFCSQRSACCARKIARLSGVLGVLGYPEYSINTARAHEGARRSSAFSFSVALLLFQRGQTRLGPARRGTVVCALHARTRRGRTMSVWAVRPPWQSGMHENAELLTLSSSPPSFSALYACLCLVLSYVLSPYNPSKIPSFRPPLYSSSRWWLVEREFASL